MLESIIAQIRDELRREDARVEIEHCLVIQRRELRRVSARFEAGQMQINPRLGDR